MTKVKHAPGTILAYLVVAEPIRRRCDGETACNYDEIEIAPGRYPVTVPERRCGDMLDLAMTGPVVSSSWTNRLLWASSTEVDRNVGQVRTYHGDPYEHGIAAALLGVLPSPRDARWELANGFEAVRIPFTDWNGDARETFGIVPTAVRS